MCSYAVRFISVNTLSYQAVWWRLFHAPDVADFFPPCIKQQCGEGLFNPETVENPETLLTVPRNNG